MVKQCQISKIYTHPVALLINYRNTWHPPCRNLRHDNPFCCIFTTGDANRIRYLIYSHLPIIHHHVFNVFHDADSCTKYRPSVISKLSLHRVNSTSHFCTVDKTGLILPTMIGRIFLGAKTICFWY